MLKTVVSFCFVTKPISAFLKKSLLLSLIFFSPLSLGKTDIEGSLLIRSLSHQNFKSFSNYSQLYLNGKFHPSNELKIQTHFLFSQFYGEAPFSLEIPIEVYPSASWFIHEDIQLKLGRNLYNNPFHQIVSSNSYEASLYSFDGVFLEYSTSILNVNFWSAYLPKRWVGLKQEQELKYGLGFFLDIKFTENYIDSFNFHVAYLANSLTQQSDEKMSRYGLALKGLIQPVNLNYTFIAIGHGPGFQFKMEENMYHFILNYFRPDFFNSRIFTGYHTDSSKYEPWLYDRHENAGLSDIFLWGNLSYYFAGLSVSPINHWDIKVIFYDFNATQNGSVELGYLGAWIHKNQNSSIPVPQKKLGKELDLQIMTQISKEFQIKLTAGLFFSHIKSENFLKDQSFYNNVQLAGLYKF
ncbi:MAG: hypothetical protein OXJ52_10350 [Oligoflexia bacterium]|nr:hypothetical protein [Oligoflexia bacterium]